MLAAVSEDRERLIAEAADLIYHLLVVSRARGIALAEVEAALAGAHEAIRPGGKSRAFQKVSKGGSMEQRTPTRSFALPHRSRGPTGRRGARTRR